LTPGLQFRLQPHPKRLGGRRLTTIGIWEARAIPGSPLVMATAAAHHAMSAGTIILLDVTKGVEDLAPITRFTPEVPFPEWESPAGSMGDFSEALRKTMRWPGHCYRSPYPLAETCCLAAYSYDPLVGEPRANRPNMFGLYYVDRFGNNPKDQQRQLKGERIAGPDLE